MLIHAAGKNRDAGRKTLQFWRLVCFITTQSFREYFKSSRDCHMYAIILKLYYRSIEYVSDLYCLCEAICRWFSSSFGFVMGFVFACLNQSTTETNNGVCQLN